MKSSFSISALSASCWRFGVIRFVTRDGGGAFGAVGGAVGLGGRATTVPAGGRVVSLLPIGSPRGGRTIPVPVVRRRVPPRPINLPP